MNAFPDEDPWTYTYPCFPSENDISSNSVKALCGVALKATVSSSGFVYLTPLSTATYKYVMADYEDPEYDANPGESKSLPCQYMNASGLLQGVDRPCHPLLPHPVQQWPLVLL
jgi:hypothetical protein